MGFQCTLPHDDDLAPTEPACWLGEVCEVLLHCLFVTVNLDHNTRSIFFNIDFIQVLQSFQNGEHQSELNLEMSFALCTVYYFKIGNKI